MSAAARAIEKAKERAAQEARETETAIIMGLAALFRAAGIVRADDADVNVYRNTVAITQAREFMNACKTAGLWPEIPK